MDKICSECNVPFSGHGNCRYCETCAQLGTQRRRDRHRYDGNRQAVLERDGYRCQQCGQPYVEERRNLVVHHLDRDPANNALVNLITFCRSCHPHVHGPQTAEVRANMSRIAKERGFGKWMTDRKRPRELVERTAAKNRGRKHTPEAIARMRQAKREWWARQTPERRRAIATAISASHRQKQDCHAAPRKSSPPPV